MIEAAPITIELMYYHKYTTPMLVASGCTIKQEDSKVELTVIFPPGSSRQEYRTELAHVRKFVITLPDGSQFYELYHLKFNSSTISPPFYKYPQPRKREQYIPY